MDLGLTAEAYLALTPRRLRAYATRWTWRAIQDDYRAGLTPAVILTALGQRNARPLELMGWECRSSRADDITAAMIALRHPKLFNK